ncbi:MAG: DUF4870 domain-containing protein [Dysgonamonadaceae bacterium]
MKYEDLKILDDLYSKGSITRDEYEREKTKILNDDTRNFSESSSSNPLWGLNENSYLMLMHLSQFLGFLILGLGFIAPIIMWVINKDKYMNVDRHGKNILNFMISYLIYTLIAGILVVVLIGIPALIAIAIIVFILIIIAAIKANNGEYWVYPFTINFII